MKIIESIELLLKDRMELLANLPDKSFDLAIIDPEYGINVTTQKLGEHNGYKSSATKGRLNQGSGKLKNRILNQSDIDWDSKPPPPEFFKEIFRVSKNQIIFGGNYFPILWDKPSRGIGYWNKKQPWDNFSQFELIWTSFDCPAFEVKCSSRGGNNFEEKFHPTQKPSYVYKYLLNKFGKLGDKILDTGFGSASIAIACYDYGYELLACDNKEQYYNDAIDRLSNYIMMHPKLFI